MTADHSQFDHERYEELCALATAGALTEKESETLFAHIDHCAECSKIFAQYQSLANEGMPMLNDLHRSSSSSAPQFDEATALNRLLDKAKTITPEAIPSRFTLLRFTPNHAWRGLIAAMLLVGIAFGSYQLGERRHKDPIVIANFPAPKVGGASDSHKLQVGLEESQAREAQLQSLAASREEEIQKLGLEEKAAQSRLDTLNESLATSKTDAASQVASLTAQRDSSTAKLHVTEQSFQAVQEELVNLRTQRKQDVVQIASLQSQVGGLTVALNDRDKRAKSDEDYLASDKDVRDLIGARNLYIADIMDVNETGQSRKPFGRVFYTKTKSLIFYAYDLDRQPGVKQTSTFHVWGRTSAKDTEPINLGLLYMDSETNRRWTLRVDDPEQLARLDAVFVTIEPGKQIEKPSGKPFLYASLRREPNHP